jgi:hypothetical protein
MIEYIVTIADGPHLFDITVKEPTRDPDVGRQTALFFASSYTAGVTHDNEWWAPHTIRTIKWKEVDE